MVRSEKATTWLAVFVIVIFVFLLLFPMLCMRPLKKLITSFKGELFRTNEDDSISLIHEGLIGDENEI